MRNFAAGEYWLNHWRVTHDFVTGRDFIFRVMDCEVKGRLYPLSIKQDLSQGKIPTEAVGNSVMFIVAGILLIIPGFLSDILAILCVLPFSRKWIQAFVINSVKNKVFMHFTAQTSSFSVTSAQDSNTFDAEFERKPDEQDQHNRIK